MRVTLITLLLLIMQCSCSLSIGEPSEGDEAEFVEELKSKRIDNIDSLDLKFFRVVPKEYNTKMLALDKDSNIYIVE